MKQLSRTLSLALALLCLWAANTSSLYGQDQAAIPKGKSVPTLRDKFSFYIGLPPELRYERALTDRTLLTSSLGFSFAAGKNSSSFQFGNSDRYEYNESYFTGLVPTLHAGLRYYPFRISSTRWVKNRGVYGELGTYALFNPLRLFPSGAYKRYSNNNIELTPVLLGGFRAQIFGVIELEIALGAARNIQLGPDDYNKSKWAFASRLMIGLSL